MNPLLGEQLTQTVRLDGKYLVDGCESVHFYFYVGMIKKKKKKKGSTIQQTKIKKRRKPD